MKQDALQQTSKYAKAHQRKRRWYKAVSCLAVVVVFCTTYALIMGRKVRHPGARP